MEKSKIKNIISVTLLSFFVSLPITIYNNYEINIISIFMKKQKHKLKK